MSRLNSEQIKSLLKKKRFLSAQRTTLSSLQRQGNILTKKQVQRLKWLEKYELCISAWTAALSEDEAYVVQRHLIDGIDWPRIATEYNGKWGAENAKTDRTLMSYQKKALYRIQNDFDTFGVNWDEFLESFYIAEVPYEQNEKRQGAK